MNKRKNNILNAKNKKGYSLIEIVVVIAIIGILLSLSTVGYTRVRNNSVNKTRESEAKTLATALENFARYNDTLLTCSLITAAPSSVANTLEIKEDIITDKTNSSITRISCTKRTRPSTSDSFFVSGLGCPTITVQYKKEGTTEKGAVTAKGPKDGSEACITPDPDGV